MTSSQDQEVSKHVFEWTVSPSSSNIQMKTFDMVVFDKMQAYCTVAHFTQVTNQQQRLQFGSPMQLVTQYTQLVSYEIHWPQKQEKPLDYCCFATATSNSGGGTWNDGRSGDQFQLSSARAPAGTITASNNNGSLTIKIEVSFRGRETMPSSCFYASFASQFFDGFLSDIQLKCKGETFSCHRIILAGRSEVFKTMFSSSLREASSKEVDIKETSPDILQWILFFIYHDSIEDRNISWELFEAAKLYQLPQLVDTCLVNLKKNLAVASCCNMLEATFVHDLEDLFKYAMEFTKKNKAEVAKTEGWKRVTKNPELLAKMLLHLM